MSGRTGSGSGSKRRKRSYTSVMESHGSRRSKEENLIGIRREKRARLRFPALTAIPQLLQSLLSEYPAFVSEITCHLHALLELDDQSTPIDDVLKDIILPRFVKFLEDDEDPKSQLEALWVLTNLAEVSPKHINVMVAVGVIFPLVCLLSDDNDEEILAQAIHVLGLIANDSPTFRDRALNNGSLPPLLSLVESFPGSSTLIARTLCTLVRGKSLLNFR